MRPSYHAAGTHRPVWAEVLPQIETADPNRGRAPRNRQWERKAALHPQFGDGVFSRLFFRLLAPLISFFPLHCQPLSMYVRLGTDKFGVDGTGDDTPRCYREDGGQRG